MTVEEKLKKAELEWKDDHKRLKLAKKAVRKAWGKVRALRAAVPRAATTDPYLILRHAAQYVSKHSIRMKSEYGFFTMSFEDWHARQILLKRANFIKYGVDKRPRPWPKHSKRSISDLAAKILRAAKDAEVSSISGDEDWIRDLHKDGRILRLSLFWLAKNGKATKSWKMRKSEFYPGEVFRKRVFELIPSEPVLQAISHRGGLNAEGDGRSLRPLRRGSQEGQPLARQDDERRELHPEPPGGPGQIAHRHR